MKLVGFCDKDTAVGLRLAGISELFIANGDEIQIWNNLIERNDIGVVFVTEKIASVLGKRMNDYRLRSNLPIVAEIPDKKGRMKDHEDYISHLIKKAVGIDISKEKP